MTIHPQTSSTSAVKPSKLPLKFLCLIISDSRTYKRVVGSKSRYLFSDLGTCACVYLQDMVYDENSPKHIERLYCGHLLHQDCLLKYLKLPPFGNKQCTICGVLIFHSKWRLSDKLAEARWAHEQARERELAEVEDFFK